MNDKILHDLYKTLESRKKADPKSSYTASLYAEGLSRIARKVMEEAYETVEAARLLESHNGKKEDLVHEIADLWFHTLVLACQQNLKLSDIYQELEKRMGISGHEEKQRRKSE